MKLSYLTLLVLLTVHIVSFSPYHTKLASRLTYHSAITYEDEASIISWTCDKCKGIDFVSPQIVKNDTNSVFGYIGYSPEYNRIIIAFRGSVDTANWIMNLKTTRTSYPLCDGCSVHVGFNQGFNSIKVQVEAIVENLFGKYPSASIYLTGHSLGGALTVMAAAHLQSRYGKVDQLYTMGQPRVGNDVFAAFMTQFIPSTFRVVNYGDQVPHVPQSILGFKHSGWEIWYQRGMK